MRWLCGMLGATVLGGIGWALGARVGLETAVILGAAGSGLGLYWARRWFDDWLG
ncbi:MAG: hypothetical protein KGJ55_12300 [Gammaproteobacteria bacterium]|nr:hypothetical protein [Gammaproteobacteria bacterium]